MLARMHDTASITALILGYSIAAPTDLSLATIITAIFANLIGGITPDIDQPTAPLWRNLPIGRVVGKIFGLLSGGHRFITHSFIGLFIFGALCQALLQLFQPIIPKVDVSIVWWSFMLGMFSHLVMDSFTKEGVPWLLPIPFKLGLPPIRRLRITTGKWLENWIVFPILIGINGLLIASHYADLLSLLRHAY